MNLTAFPTVTRSRLTTLQVNLGYRCNQSCAHCHVNAGPTRTEMMAEELVDLIPSVLHRRGLQCLDLTGGAPELHPGFRRLVTRARDAGVVVIDRCNLTILNEPGHEDLAAFLASHGVTVIASLPCYSKDNVDRQRGDGVYERSLNGLRQLNALGYGTGTPITSQPRLQPAWPITATSMAALKADYNELVNWTSLRPSAHPGEHADPTLARQLELSGELSYQQRLQEAHNPDNLDAVMCRSLISVDWTTVV